MSPCILRTAARSKSVAESALGPPTNVFLSVFGSVGFSAVDVAVFSDVLGPRMY